MTETSQFDNPNDIASMNTLKIQTVSRNISPKIYANGRNQLPIEITAKAVKKVNDNDVPLHFSNETWIQLLNLRFAESDQKLTRKGNSGWCFTDVKNDYSRELQMAHSSKPSFNVKDDGTVIIIMYVYTNDIDTKRIAVSVDTDNGKHFTTADNTTTVEKMSVHVTAFIEIIYRAKDLKTDFIKEIGKKKNPVSYRICYNCGLPDERIEDMNKMFDCHYDNYYISVPFGVKNATIYNHNGNSDLFKWICAYDSEHDNQHMIIAHPYNKKSTDIFGFQNNTQWQAGWSAAIWNGYFDLTQNVTYNETPNAICFTQMAFATGSEDVWQLPDGKGLDIGPFKFDTWFELYDIYGNYGNFNVGFTDDHQYIKITDR